MHSGQRVSSFAAYKQVSIFAGALALVAGVAVLAGWVLDIPRLTDFTFDGITMKANAALALALTGASLLLLAFSESGTFGSNVGRALAVCVSIIGSLTLSEHLVGWDLGVDQMIASELPGSPATVSPGRMGPPASTCYTLLGIALVLLHRRTRRAAVALQAIALVIVSVTMLNLVGNLFSAPELYALAPYTGISRQTAILLLVAAIGLLTARAGDGLMDVFTSAAPGGIIFRRLLLPAVFVPAAFGGIFQYGINAGWFDVSFGIALFSLALAAALVGIIAVNSRTLNFLDMKRQRAEQERERLLDSERHARTEVERAARLKDEFLATVTHELRTPLNAMFGWLHLLRSKRDDAEMTSKAIEVIQRNLNLQLRLIEDLLDMSRIISGKMRLEFQFVDLHAVIHAALESVRLAAEQRGLRLQIELGPVDGVLLGDPGRLQQIIWNLLSNAVKFSPHGGHVKVSLVQHGSVAEINVSDTGQGISPEFLPYVFDRFRQADASMTRSHGGLGLGLAIVKQLVDLHGGRITIQSEGVGCGVTATVQLPVSRKEREFGDSDGAPAREHEAVASEASDLNGVSVLAVDDEPDGLELVVRVLGEWGAKVTSATSSIEALALLKKSKFDLLISDIGMPDMSGYELMRTVRRQGHVLPAIAVSAYPRIEDRTQALEAGFQSYITKPLDPSKLVSATLEILRRSSAALPRS